MGSRQCSPHVSRLVICSGISSSSSSSTIVCSRAGGRHACVGVAGHGDCCESGHRMVNVWRHSRVLDVLDVGVVVGAGEEDVHALFLGGGYCEC